MVAAKGEVEDRFSVDEKRHLKSLFLIGVLSLSACDSNFFESRTRDPRWVELPALPIIQRAVSSLVPLVDGQRNDLMMSQVCALARGDSSSQQVAQVLMQQGIDLTRIPQKNHPMSLLVVTDNTPRIIACAAYIASSVMTLPKRSEFLSDVPTEPVSATTLGGKNATSDNELAKTQSIDPQKLQRFLAVQLTVAKADADLFSLIASELAKKPGLNLEQLNVRAQSLFKDIAPAYLQRVKELYPAQNPDFTLLEYSDTAFRFSTGNGYLFEYGYDGLTLKFNRISWYGEGQLLGKFYRLDVNYFDPELVQILKNNSTGLVSKTPGKPDVSP